MTYLTAILESKLTPVVTERLLGPLVKWRLGNRFLPTIEAMLKLLSTSFRLFDHLLSVSEYITMPRDILMIS